MRLPFDRLVRQKVYAGSVKLAYELLRTPFFTFVSRRVKLWAHMPESVSLVPRFSIQKQKPRSPVSFREIFQEAALGR